MKSIDKKIFCIVCLFFTTQFINFSLWAQEYSYINEELNLRIEKEYSNDSNLHSAIRPFLFSKSAQSDTFKLISHNTSNNAFLNKLFNKDLFNLEKGQNRFFINPIITVAADFEVKSKKAYNNAQLGLTIGGQLGNKLAFRFDGFYGLQSFTDDLAKVIDSTGMVPHYGKYLQKTGGFYHYSGIETYLSYSPLSYLNLQAGIGKNFWGDGYRSLFLSDNSNSYPFAKVTANIWKFKYIWLFGALKDYNSDYQDNKLHSKLLFSHFLSWNATKWLNINFFESIVANPIDSMGVSYFNLNYLNPIIFFRPVEFAGGSADNALLGFGFKLKLWKKYQFYSQFTLDEFILSEMTSGSGWWGNKYGIQAGLKVFDLLNIKNLFGRLEYNQIRPYTYSYSNSILSYGNQYQALAHPSGANFEEILFQIHYHKNRLSLQIKAIHSKAGMDTDSISYGKNIYKSYEDRKSEYGNSLGQGFPASFSGFEFKSAWLFNKKMNLQIIFSTSYQKIKTYESDYNNVYILLGIKSLIHSNGIDFL